MQAGQTEKETYEMKLMTFANSQPQSLALERILHDRFQSEAIEVTEMEEEADYVITVGGDGTLLSAFHHFQPYLDQVKFIGVHTGHLGFYTDWQVDELDDLIRNLKVLKQDASDVQVSSYPLLSAKLTELGGQVHHFLALNELSLRSFEGTMTCQVYIGSEFFETFRGDGLCVATPTGSTGLNKSLGGAVLHPSLDALQLTEMASLNNRVYRTLSSPIIIAKEDRFILKPDPYKTVAVSIDNRPVQHLQIAMLELTIAPQRIRFADIKHNQFWNRVENSFIGLKQNLDSEGDTQEWLS